MDDVIFLMFFQMVKDGGFLFRADEVVLGWAGPHGLLRLTHPTGGFVVAGDYGLGASGSEANDQQPLVRLKSQELPSDTPIKDFTK